MGDLELAVTPYLRTAESTDAGVTWENRRGMRPRRHHIAHGTLGVAYALAATADATGRGDLMELALAGVADVVARNDSPGPGFLAPHSDPQQDPDRIERYSYGWCHGPTGDAQVFRLLHQLTADGKWLALQDACWNTVIESGVPRRHRPGFWDNSGRCCGCRAARAGAAARLGHGKRRHRAGAAALRADHRRRTRPTPSRGPTSHRCHGSVGGVERTSAGVSTTIPMAVRLSAVRPMNRGGAARAPAAGRSQGRAG